MSSLNHTAGHILYLDGAFGTTMNRKVRHQIASLLRCGERQIIVDLAQVTSIDAAGVGELVRAHNMARAAGATIYFVNAAAHVRELIARVGLGDILLTDPVTTM